MDIHNTERHLFRAWAHGLEEFSHELRAVAEDSALCAGLLQAEWGDKVLQCVECVDSDLGAYLLGRFCSADASGAFGRAARVSPALRVLSGLVSMNHANPLMMLQLVGSAPGPVASAAIKLMNDIIPTPPIRQSTALETVTSMQGAKHVPHLALLRSIQSRRALHAALTLQRCARVWLSKRRIKRQRAEVRAQRAAELCRLTEEWSAVMIQTHVRRMVARAKVRRQRKLSGLGLLIWVQGESDVPSLLKVFCGLPEAVHSKESAREPTTHEGSHPDYLQMVSNMGDHPCLRVAALGDTDLSARYQHYEGDTAITLERYITVLGAAMDKGDAWGVPVWDVLVTLASVSSQLPATSHAALSLLVRHRAVIIEKLTYEQNANPGTFTARHTEVVELLLNLTSTTDTPPVSLTQVDVYCGLRCMKREEHFLTPSAGLHVDLYLAVMRYLLEVRVEVLSEISECRVYGLLACRGALGALWDVVGGAFGLLAPLGMRDAGMVELRHAHAAVSVIKRAWRGTVGRRSTAKEAETVVTMQRAFSGLEEQAVGVLRATGEAAVTDLSAIIDKCEALKDTVFEEAEGRLDVELEEAYAIIAIVDTVRTEHKVALAAEKTRHRAAVCDVQNSFAALSQGERDQRRAITKRALEYYKEAARHKKIFTVQMKYIFGHLFDEASQRRGIEGSEHSHRDLLVRYEVSCRITPLQRARNIQQRKTRHLRYLEAARSRPPATYSPPRARSHQRKRSTLPSISPTPSPAHGRRSV